MINVGVLCCNNYYYYNYYYYYCHYYYDVDEKLQKVSFFFLFAFKCEGKGNIIKPYLCKAEYIKDTFYITFCNG